MGRRDEPDLDELSKLLRRLETMEARPSPKAHAKQRRTRRSRKPNMSAPCAVPRPPKSPTAAADLHTMYVRIVHAIANRRREDHPVVEHLGDRHRRRDGGRGVVGRRRRTGAVDRRPAERGERRLTFYAPGDRPVHAAADPGASAPAVQPATDTAPTNAQSLLQRADVYLRGGKPGEARVVLEQAAQLGSGVAALTLGAMYDPGRPHNSAISGLRPTRPWRVPGTSGPRTSASPRQTTAWRNSPRDDADGVIGPRGRTARS